MNSSGWEEDAAQAVGKIKVKASQQLDGSFSGTQQVAEGWGRAYGKEEWSLV